MVNVYGPTETTLAKLFYLIKPSDVQRETIPIGSPISGARVIILNKELKICGPGEVGEIYIRTPFRSYGYYNDPALTAQKFIKNPFSGSPGDIIYKTGDLGKWNRDGLIEFVGREDRQVKIRGFRVELDEIEKRLREYPGIVEAVVLYRSTGSGNYILCAYYRGEIPVPELKTYLNRELPDYMIPSFYIKMETFPLSVNGKINYRALPEPDAVEREEFTAPGSEMEKRVVKIWSEILGLEKIGINDGFLDMGGNSLNAMSLTAGIYKEFGVNLQLAAIFENPTAAELVSLIEASGTGIYQGIEPVEEREYYPLSSAQMRMYLLREFAGPDDISYNQPKPLHIKGRLEIKRLEESFKRLIVRHEALRTGFETIAGQPVQRVHNDVEFGIEYYEVEGQGGLENFIRPFDLSRPPLLQVGLLKISEEEHILIFDIHHIISDGVTTGIFIDEMMEFYHNEPMSPLPIQYKDYALWQQEMLQSEHLEKQERYWLEVFKEEAPVLNLSTDFPRPALQSFEGSHWNFTLESQLIRQLEFMARERSATLYMVLLTAYTALLYRYTGQEDIVVGSPIAGRPHADLQRIPGVFINTLAMRNRPDCTKTFEQFLAEVMENAFEAYENQDYPFEELVGKLDLRRDLQRNPLFETFFIMQNIDMTPIRLEGLEIEPYPFDVPTSKFDISLNALETPQGLLFTIEYCTRLFRQETVERFSRHFVTLLATAAKNPQAAIGKIDILSPEEKEQLLHRFNDTAGDFPGDRTVHELFAEQAERCGDSTAAVCNTRTPGPAAHHLTYRELNRKSDELAAVLGQKGVASGDIVGLMASRSNEMIIGMLGILKAGAAYLPIDAGFPQERIDYMLKDSGARLLLAAPAAQVKVEVKVKEKAIEIIDISKKSSPSTSTSTLTCQVSSANLAYIIYTSGTTGNPKGVMVKHRNVINLIFGLNRNIYSRYQGNLKVVLVAPYVFDASVQQIFGVLLPGHTLCIVPEETRIDGEALKEFYRRYCIDISDGTPTHLRLMVEGIEGFTGLHLKHFIIGGEALPRSLVADFLNQFEEPIPKITNVYGPTECCVDSTWYEMSKETVNELHTIPIGKPMPNQQIHIVNQQRQLQPIGVPGELCISGDSLGRGYLNQPELTVEKFVLAHSSWLIADRREKKANSSGELPMSYELSAMSCLYRTGDLARWLPDGNIEFLGRIDHQVKIRGFRIELEEIEKQLIRYTYDYNEKGDEHAENISSHAVDVGQTGDRNKVTYCSRCVLSSDYPGIHFDRDSVCNICREYEKYEHYAKDYFKTIHDFHRLVETARATKKSEYDCMLLFSGGKDSSYVLSRLVEMGLNVLAFTFDNGYISDTAFENIRRITFSLGGYVDSIVCRTPKMKEIFVESLSHDHTVCNGCFKALTTVSTRVAVERGINMVITGLSRGQIFNTKLQGLYLQGIFDVNEVEEKLVLFRKMYHSGGDKISRLLSTYTCRKFSGPQGNREQQEEHSEISIESFTDRVFQDIHFVDFFRYDNASVSEIKSYLESKDIYWQQPGDTGFCSTNCTINDVGIYAFTRAYGYHNYAAPLSWDCRLGKSTREEALKEIEFEPDLPKINRILKEIGYFARPIRDACVVDREDKNGNRYLCAYIVTGRSVTLEDVPGSRELREYLSRILPDYMIPSFFVPLEKLPLTLNGKIDRKILPSPQITAAKEGTTAVPRDVIEKKLAVLWSEVLKIDKEKISIDDNFFESGGHSLSATILLNRIQKSMHIKVPLSAMFETPTIRKLSQYIKTKGIPGDRRDWCTAIEPLELKEYYPLSSAQKRLYILWQMERRDINYNMLEVFSLEGRVDIGRFETTFRRLIRRHESLRTSFTIINDEPVQRIHDNVEFEMEYYELTAEERKKKPKEILQDKKLPTANCQLPTAFIRPFDLSRVPLMRVGLVKQDQQKHLLVVEIHHIIIDGTSVGVFIKDFTALYKEEALPPLLIHYKDFAQWQNRRKQDESLKRQEAYWIKEFSGELPELNLPLDFERPSKQNFEGTRVSFEISGKTTKALKALVVEEEVTLFIVLLAVLNVLLWKLSGSDAIVVGSPIAGRPHADLEGIIGMFVNTLALKNSPLQDISFKFFLKEVRQKTQEAYENQEYQFEDLVEKVMKKRKPGRHPIFDIVFVLQNMDIPEITIPGLTLAVRDFTPGIAQFDIYLVAEEKEERLTFKLGYSTRLFKKETIERFTGFFREIIDGVIADREIRLKDIEISHRLMEPNTHILKEAEGDFGF